MTFPRVSRHGRHFANVGDVIIYPDVVVARTIEIVAEMEPRSRSQLKSARPNVHTESK